MAGMSVDESLQTLMSFAYSYEDPATGDDTVLRRQLQPRPADDGTATLATNYHYNAANQLTHSVGGLVAHSYDANGNYAQSTAGERFTYNAANQTISMRTAKGVPATFEYVGPGQAERTEVAVEGLPVTTFAYGPLGVVSEIVGSAATTHYVRDDTGQILAQHGPAGVHYYVPDGVGSTAGLVDASGEIAAIYRYDTFGNVIDSSGLVELTRFRYAGQYLDHTGLYKMGERYYDPTIGRWTQQDRIHDPLDPKQWNRYVYVGGDPVNFVDPSGLDSEPQGFVRCFSDKFLGVHHPGFERATIEPTWPPFQGWKVDWGKVAQNVGQEAGGSILSRLWEGTKKLGVKIVGAGVNLYQGIRAAWDCRNA